MSVGFKFGPATVVRLCKDPKLGAWILVQGARESVEIRVTKGGRLRVGRVEKTTQSFSSECTDWTTNIGVMPVERSVENNG